MKDSRRRVLVILLVAASSTTVSTAVLAALSAITVQSEPITVGQTVTYTTVEDGKNGPGTWTWDFRATAGGNQGAWVGMPSGGTTSQVVENRVGSFNVRCQASYMDQTTSVVIRSVTVQGPDSDVITQGLNVSTEQTSLEVHFDVLNGSTPIGYIGSDVDGYPQERIRRPQYNFDSGFTGPAPGAFYSQGNTIIDVKQTNMQDPAFINAAIGAVVDDFYQQNRMVIKDGFLQDQFFYFVERHFQRVKTGANSWKLILAP